MASKHTSVLYTAMCSTTQLMIIPKAVNIKQVKGHYITNYHNEPS